jgi:hypothetical protein
MSCFYLNRCHGPVFSGAKVTLREVMNTQACLDACRQGQLATAQLLHDQGGVDFNAGFFPAVWYENPPSAVAKWLISLGGVAKASFFRLSHGQVPGLGHAAAWVWCCDGM